MKTMSERAARSNEIKQSIHRAEEIKVRMQFLDNELRTISVAMRPENDLATHWRNSIEGLRRKFVSDLAVRANGNKLPHIDFSSSEAMAFINGDQWLAAIPELAERVGGKRNADADYARMGAINQELAQLNQDLAKLGF